MLQVCIAGQQPYSANSLPAEGFQQHGLAGAGRSSRALAVDAKCRGAPLQVAAALSVKLQSSLQQ